MRFQRTVLIAVTIICLLLSAWMPAGNPAPLPADWCQCVVFVLNLLGIQQIPGEYWTAASLAVPDQAGLTWMDYQGYRKRQDVELPETGDLLVLNGGAEVITEQTWGGSEHLVPVQVDAWAGHLGIVLRADEVEKDGTIYWKIHLLSANWGVNSHALGVVGSCFNVDESSFLLPVGYKKAAFFFPSDPAKMRERMVNRAVRWARLSLPPNPKTTMDGFPITPLGFISQALDPIGPQPLVPVITDINGSLVPIPAENAIPGDILLFGENVDTGIGVVTSITNVDREKTWGGQVIYFLPGGRAKGPEDWNLSYLAGKWSKEFGEPALGHIRFMRFSRIPSYPVVTRFELQSGNIPHSLEYSIEWINGGGETLSIPALSLAIYERKESGVDSVSPVDTIKIDDFSEINPDGRASFSGSIAPLPTGDYQIWLRYTTTDNKTTTIAQLNVTIGE